MQSVMVGIGAVSASALPWLLNHLLAVENTANAVRKIPLTVELSFYIGAVLFLGTVLWTVVTTPEHPPKNLEKFEKLQEKRGGIISSMRETLYTLRQMPSTMRQLAGVQFFTWLGIFCFFLYFPPAVARNIFGAESQDSTLYSDGIEWAGLCFAVFNAICIGFSFLLPYLSKQMGRKMTHSLCLLCGGGSLISLLIIKNQYLLLGAMVGWGIAWASALTMPYAMLTSAIPAQSRRIYQGIFNFFIVLPEIFVSLGFGWVMSHLFNDNRLLAVVLGGGFLIIASGLTLLVESSPTVESESGEQKEGTQTEPQTQIT
jgi:maltose/moltooligosaccharide transporter